MDSSDDDRPIAQIAAARAKPTSAPAAMNIPKAVVRTAPAAAKKPSSAAAIDSDDDDVPLAVLMKRRLESAQGPLKTPSGFTKAAPPAKKAKIEIGSKNPSRQVNDKKTKQKSKSGKSSKASTVSSQTSRVSEFYESDKGKVVQALMVRWWYAIQWPEVGAKTTCPPGFESLDGFPGVFVGTRVRAVRLSVAQNVPLIMFVQLDNFGDIKDLRDKSSCPNFKNLWAKSTDDLKTLCDKVG